MNYFKNLRQPDRQDVDLDTYVDNQASTLWEGMKTGVQSGLATSGKITNFIQASALKGASLAGIDVDKQLDETLDRMDYTTQVARMARDSREAYLKDDNLVGSLGKGAIIGLTQMAFDPVQLSTNVALTYATGGLGKALFPAVESGALKLLGKVGSEVSENMAWDYLEKTQVLDEKYDKQYFKESLIGNVGLGVALTGLKYGARKIWGDTLTNNTNPDIDPKKAVVDLAEKAENKEIATGVPVNAEEFKKIRTFNGMTEEQLMPFIKNRKLEVEADTKVKGVEAEISKAKEVAGVDKLENEIELKKARIEKLKSEIDYEDRTQRIGTPIGKDLSLQATRDSKLLEINQLENEISTNNRKISNFTSSKEVRKLFKKLVDEKKKYSETLETSGKLENADIAKEALRLYDNDDFDIDVNTVKKIVNEELDTETKMNKIVDENVKEIENSENKIKSFEPEEDDISDFKIDDDKIKIELEDETTPKDILETKKPKIEGKPRELKDPTLKEPKAKKKTSFKGNKVVMTKLDEAISTTAEALKNAEKSKPELNTMRAILNENVLMPYRTLKREVANTLFNKLQTIENNSYLDFAGTLRKLNQSGIDILEYVYNPEKLANLNNEFGGVIKNFVSTLEKLNESVKRYNKDFNSKIAVTTAKYSRIGFIKKYSTGVDLNKGGIKNYLFRYSQFDLGKLSPKELALMQRNFINENVNYFKGATRQEQYINAGNFAKEFFDDLKHGLRGKAGKSNKYRQSALHNYSLFLKYADEKYISNDNLDKIISISGFKDNKVVLGNMIKNIAETKALTNVLGSELYDLVENGGAGLKKMFNKHLHVFANASNSYDSQVEALSYIFRKEIGLEKTIDSSWLKASDMAMGAMYEGIKPLMAVFQIIGEFGTSTLDQTVKWEDGILSIPKTIVNNLKQLSPSKRNKVFASEYYRNLIGNGLELLEDLNKEIRNMEVGEVSKKIMIMNKLGQKLSDVNDVFSLMKPFEDYFNRIQAGFALTKSKELFSKTYGELLKHPAIKSALDRVGIKEADFNFIKNAVGDLDVIEPSTLLKKLENADVSLFKERFPDLSENEIKRLFSEKLRSLQASIADSAKSTKGSEFDIVIGKGTVTSNLIAKSATFLKRSAFSAMRRNMELLFKSAQYHNTGNVVWQRQFKNMLYLTMVSPIFFYATAVSKSLRRMLTSKDDTSTILNEEFLFRDKYGYGLSLGGAGRKYIGSMAEGMYFNTIVNGTMVGSVADKASQGNFKGAFKAMTPRQIKILKKISEL